MKVFVTRHRRDATLDREDVTLCRNSGDASFGADLLRRTGSLGALRETSTELVRSPLVLYRVSPSSRPLTTSRVSGGNRTSAPEDPLATVAHVVPLHSVTGFINQAMIDIASDDDGGEMDPHGADNVSSRCFLSEELGRHCEADSPSPTAWKPPRRSR